MVASTRLGLIASLAALVPQLGQLNNSPSPILTGLVFASEVEERIKVPEALALRPGGPGKDAKTIVKWADENVFHFFARDQRGYLVDKRLTRADQGSRLVQGITAAVAAWKGDDASLPVKDPAVRGIVSQVQESYGLSAGQIGTRVVVGPVRRCWLTDGKEWLAVDLPPALPPETMAQLRDHQAPDQPSPKTPAPPQAVPGQVAEILPIGRLALTATGDGANDPRQRAKDLRTIANFVADEFERTATQVDKARQALDDASRAILEKVGGQLPEVGDLYGDLSPQWRAAVDSILDHRFKDRPLAERQAFVSSLRVAQWSKNIEVLWMGKHGFEIRELRGP
ncbi:MAG: hypothetical protein KIS64_11910 [Fimbriimonadaceae bacterium]|nr:hypothetical protein [Fimbriimonadaceae bacterium]